MGSLIRGSIGGQKVLVDDDIIFDGMKTSAKLGVVAAIIALICGVILGSVAALRRNKLIDRIIMIITTAFVSMPSIQVWYLPTF